MSGEPGGPVFIRIAADGTRWPGFTAVDGRAEALAATDFRLPFADGSVAGAHVDHVLERLDLAAGARLLHEVRRVLARGGRARVVTDDLGRILDEHASSDAWVAGGWRENGYDWHQQRVAMLNRAFRDPQRRWLYDAAEIARIATTIGLRQPARCRPRASADPRLAGGERASEADLIVELEKPRRTDGYRPLVSVLVPLYRTTYLERTIASVLDQTYDNFEVVIRDDGPPGGAEAILRGFAQHPRFPRIRYTHNGNRLGEPHNFVACFREAAGTYIKYLNDDDLLAPRCLEVMAACLRDHPDVTLVTSHRDLIDAGGSLLPPKSFSERPVGRSSIISGRSAIARLLSQKLNFIGEPSTVMFRKADIETAAPDFWSLGGINFQGNGDVTVWTNLLAQGDLLYLTETLSQFRHHPQQSSQDRGVLRLAQVAWPRIAAGASELGLYRPGEIASLETRPLQTISWWPAPLRRRVEQAQERARGGRSMELLAETSALLAEAGGRATPDAELMVQLAELRFAAGDLRGALDLAITATRTTPHHQPAHLLVARLLQAGGDARGAQKMLEETHALCPLIRNEHGLHPTEAGPPCLAADTRFRAEADLPDAVIRLHLKARTTAGFRNLPIRITAAVAAAAAGAQAAWPAPEPAALTHAELGRDDETVALVLALPHRATPTAITIAWRGTPEHYLPAAVAALPVQLVGLELSLFERSAIN